MKNVELKVSKMSSVVVAPGCPKYSQQECGIMYRG